MSKPMIDGKEVKTGDRLWHYVLNEWVLVIEIIEEDGDIKHCFVWDRESTSDVPGCSLGNGKDYPYGNQVLFWREMVLVPKE